MPWVIIAFFAPWLVNCWQPLHNKIAIRWMKNSILNALHPLHLKTTGKNLKSWREVMNNPMSFNMNHCPMSCWHMLTPPDLDDETVVKLNDFLYELLEAFESH